MTAEWLHDNDDRFDWYECSNCGYGDDYEVTEISQLSRYCPACGKMMKNSTWPPNKDIGACGDKYFANMVSASSGDGYEQMSEYHESDTGEFIEYGKWYIAGYLYNGYRGLMEDLYSDDFEEILSVAADMAGQGLYIEITNRADGRSKRYTPDDFEEAASYGEYPDHIREDLAL